MADRTRVYFFTSIINFSNDRWFESRQGWDFFSPPRPDRPWGPPSLLSNSYQELFHWGIKQPGHEAGHPPPPSAVVKNAWSYISTPPIRLHGVVPVLPLTEYHAMKAHWGTEGTAPPIPDLGTTRR
jgi:hypothetical protein